MSVLNKISSLVASGKIRTKYKSIRFGRCLPGFIVIGTQKGGTTALHNYLSIHPQLAPTTNKELNYFNSIADNRIKETDYHNLFPVKNDKFCEKMSYDVSPAYMLDAGKVARNIFQYSAAIKIIALLRDPVERAISAWHMCRKYSAANKNWFNEADWVVNGFSSNKNLVTRAKKFGVSFEADIEEEIDALNSNRRIEIPIVEYGFYEKQLAEFYGIFPGENILVLDSDRLKMETATTLVSVTRFLGLNKMDWEKQELTPQFVGDYQHNIDSKTRCSLEEIYNRENQGLTALTGERFSWLEI